jgi:hypothetical protein
MTPTERIVWGDSPDDAIELMEFRLVYEGSLKSGQGNGTTQEKHQIRKTFHKQLAHLWEITPELKRRTEDHSILSAPDEGVQPRTVTAAAAIRRDSLTKTLGDNFNKCGFKFVPLVSKALNLTCGLEVLLLKKDKSTVLKKAGSSTDIDNRLNTLFDALQVPDQCQELGQPPAQPDANETPYFYCLVENDNLITDIRVTVDDWLAPFTPLAGTLGAGHPEQFVHLVITVKVRPSVVSFENYSFIG